MSVSAAARAEPIGRVAAVTGCNVTIELTARPLGEQPTVGKFVGVTTPKVVIIGLVTEVCEEADGGAHRG